MNTCSHRVPYDRCVVHAAALAAAPTVVFDDEPDPFEGFATFEATKRVAVSGHACCDSGSCHNRRLINAKARTPRSKR